MSETELNKRTNNKVVDRDGIIGFENILKKHPGSFVGDSKNCPLKHSFSDGIYVREITIPAGMIIVGKIHKHEHPNFLLKGKVFVITEDGGQELTAPCSMISKAGTKRALYAITELVWTTIHHNPTNTQNLEELEKIIIASSYKNFDKFVLKTKTLVSRTKKILIKILNK